MLKTLSIWGTLAVLFFFPVGNGFCAPRGGVSADRVARIPDSDAMQMWDKFVRTNPAGGYCMDFEISHLPRRGEKTVYIGSLWGGTYKGANVLRIVLQKESDGKYSDYLAVSRPDSSCEIFKFEGGKAVAVQSSNISDPLIEGLIFSPMDLSMPYRYWPGAKYVGPERIGQAVHLFDVPAPENYSGGKFAFVRTALGRDFGSPVQVQTLDKNLNPLKTMSVSAIKKMDGLWFASKFEVRDETSRDKDVLKITKAAVNLDFSSKDGIFDRQTIENNSCALPSKPKMEEL